MVEPTVLRNPYLRYHFLFADIFSPSECQRMIQTAQPYPVSADPYAAVHPSTSPCGVRRILTQEADHLWILNRLRDIGFQVNQQYYHFAISGMEMPHVCEYQNQQMAEWHMDITDDVTSNRKLTILVFLSDPQDYTGGEFHCYPTTEPLVQTQGSVLFFPAFFLHKVTPVLTGTRYSLVTWAYGPPFC